MNAERLHVVLAAVGRELNEAKTVELLQQLASGLQSQVQQPTQPQHQQNVGRSIQSLYTRLETAPSNSFSPAWNQTIDALGVSKFLGTALKARLEKVFAENRITLAVASEEIKKLSDKAAAKKSAIDHLLSAFLELKIGKEDLEPGNCEIGVLIPRTYVKNDLKAFGKEVQELDSIFKAFSELVTGSRPQTILRTISSSDFSVFLDMAPGVCACVAVAVERVVALYKQLLEIRKLHSGLKQQGVPEKSLDGVEKHANSMMSQGIDTLTDELLAQHFENGDDGRQNELRIETRLTLKKIANRIDRGFNIEIRIQPLPLKSEQDGAESQDPELQTHVETIRAASETLTFLKLTGNPILSLPESKTAERKQEQPE